VVLLWIRECRLFHVALGVLKRFRGVKERTEVS
jgi:hypothetical protein